MKNCLLVFLFLAELAHGQKNDPLPQARPASFPSQPATPKRTRNRFSLFSGYQQENFRWSIAGNSSGTNPNIYSELRWHQLCGPLLGVEEEWNIWKSFSVRSAFSRLFIVSGKVTDMDYQGDNRTGRIYYGAFDSNKGGSFSWRTSLEYKIKAGRFCWIAPGLGYVLHQQSLYLLSDDASLGNNKLKSTYATVYKGATIGVRSLFVPAKNFSLEPSLIYDQVKYHGKADWNLITNFQHPLSFEDRANGYNIETGLKGSYAWRNQFSFFLSGNYLYGNTGNGTDRLYQANGQQPLTQFNGAVRHFWGIRAGLQLSL